MERERRPLPLYLNDLDREMIRCPDDLKMKYARVLYFLWKQRGIMPGGGKVFCQVAGIRRDRSWRRKVAKLRSKLVLLSDQFAHQRTDDITVPMDRLRAAIRCWR